MFSFIFLFYFSQKAFSYPDFISYGYKSCVTCHYSGQGSGALNDYGRALLASEFTANTFTKLTPDERAEQSGFLGATEIPWWIHPGIKYRGLYYKTDLSSKDSVSRWINMQADLDLVFHLDRRQKFILVTNIGYVPTPARFKSSIEKKPENIISKQHYLRWQYDKELIFYIGLFDKFFGIRHADHTAFNRSFLGLGQADQSHGLGVQLFDKNFELSVDVFMGNLNQHSALRQVGGSFHSEYFMNSTIAIGFSGLYSSNQYKQESRFAVHSRIGYEKGRSVLAELGHYKNNGKLYSDNNDSGYYMFSQALLKISQGYNFLSTYQYLTKQMPEISESRTQKFGLGFLIFPFQRAELRFEIVNTKVLSELNTSAELWNAQSQVHVVW